MVPQVCGAMLVDDVLITADRLCRIGLHVWLSLDGGNSPNSLLIHPVLAARAREACTRVSLTASYKK
jgi:hypothetical protein